MRDQTRAHNQPGLPQSGSHENDFTSAVEVRLRESETSGNPAPTSKLFLAHSYDLQVRKHDSHPSGGDSEPSFDFELARVYTGKRGREDGEDEDEQARVPPSAPWGQADNTGALPLLPLKQEGQGSEGMSGVIDAATAAAIAGGADAETAAAMSASIAAMMADPAMSAMAAAAMADPSNPVTLQALAQLAQGQGNPNDQGFSALVAAAVGMAAMENPGAPSGATNPLANFPASDLAALNLPADFDFNAFLASNPGVLNGITGLQGYDQEDDAAPLVPNAPRGRGRPRKNPLPDGSAPPPRPPPEERPHPVPPSESFPLPLLPIIVWSFPLDTDAVCCLMLRRQLDAQVPRACLQC